MKTQREIAKCDFNVSGRVYSLPELSFDSHQNLAGTNQGQASGERERERERWGGGGGLWGPHAWQHTHIH